MKYREIVSKFIAEIHPLNYTFKKVCVLHHRPKNKSRKNYSKFFVDFVNRIIGPTVEKISSTGLMVLSLDPMEAENGMIWPTAGSFRKPVVGPQHTVTMGNGLSAEISAT